MKSHVEKKVWLWDNKRKQIVTFYTRWVKDTVRNILMRMLNTSLDREKGRVNRRLDDYLKYLQRLDAGGMLKRTTSDM